MRPPILQPCDSERFTQALKVSEWMSEQKVCNLIPEDFAARLYLIDNVLGLEEATKFFLNIPECKRDHSVYTTILSFYARSEKTLSTAESIFRKMRKVGYLSKPSPFNRMMSLYNQLGKRDMVHKILRQMEKNNVKPDNLTLNIKLRLYAAEFDIKKLGKLLAECNMNTGFALDWRTSCDIAKIYLRLGLVVKAVEMLRRAEKSVPDTESKKLAYESLMVLYGDAGKAEEVYRIWDLYKAMKAKDSEGYRSVISSLLKLGDIYMASKITREWCEGFNKFDVRIVTMMASTCCERGLIRDAEALMHNVIVTPRPPPSVGPHVHSRPVGPTLVRQSVR